MIRGHKFHTASPIATKILDNWEKEKFHFTKIVPLAMNKIDYSKIYKEQISHQMDILTKN